MGRDAALSRLGRQAVLLLRQQPQREPQVGLREARGRGRLRGEKRGQLPWASRESCARPGPRLHGVMAEVDSERAFKPQCSQDAGPIFGAELLKAGCS